MKYLFKLVLFVSLLPLNGIIQLLHAAAEIDYFELSLEQLQQLHIDVPATITKLTLAETPAAITVITADDIRLTPARNIYDLLEVYVPGAIWMNHEEGPHPGIRGNISNRNYKYLLLVNGRKMNSAAHYGAKSELELWDMSDIDRIEIIRGPGSVTYGPGAVAGIFNIITRNSKTDKENTISSRYVNKYDSTGLTIRQNIMTKNYQVYTFASVTKTKGYAAKQFLVNNNNEANYIGEGAYASNEVLDYYADYQNNPQVKLHIDVDLYDKWRLWFRYTQQGSTWRGNEVKSDFNGLLLNQQSLRDRQVTSTIEYKSSITETLWYSSMISINSYDTERRVENVRDPDPNNVKNFKSNYSETEFLLKNIYNWQATEDFELAVGFELSSVHYGPGWGDSPEKMRLGDNANIVNGLNSEAIGPKLSASEAIFVGDGWSTNTYSLFSEANVILNQSNKLLMSARVDKNTYTNFLFSPRVALISEIKKNHLIKVIAQRSIRMNTAGQLYIENLNGVKPKSETLNSLEIAYSGSLKKDKKVKLASFINETEVLSWSNSVDTSVIVGDLQLLGVEAEFEYRMENARLGINYSYVKQLSWKLSDTLTSSGISYSDYKQDLKNTNARMNGVGNDLNNWPNQSIKFFGQLKLTNRISIHANARLFWDYQGSLDGLESLRQAVQGEPEQAEVEQSLKTLNDKDVYQYDLRVNASLLYSVNKKLDLQIYAQNILNINENKRYAYDTGNTRAAPKRVRFVEEPQTIGVRLDYRF